MSWRPEIVVAEDLAAALIDQQFPSLAPVSLEHFGAGWDNTAYLAAGRYVFRFPRRSIAVPLMEAEIRLLPHVATRVSVPVPRPIFASSGSDAYPWPFAGYEVLPGRTACRCALDAGQRAALAAPLGRFLAELHGISADEARALGAGGDRFGKTALPRLLSQLEDSLERARDDLPAAERAAARRLAAALPERVPPSGTFVHGDLYARHILLGEDGALAGIIDWGDVHVGDPATDLAAAWGFLPPAAHDSFLRAYGDVDEVTWQVARVRALFVGVALVLYGRDIGDAAAEREGRAAIAHTLEGA